MMIMKHIDIFNTLEALFLSHEGVNIDLAMKIAQGLNYPLEAKIRHKYGKLIEFVEEGKSKIDDIHDFSDKLATIFNNDILEINSKVKEIPKDINMLQDLYSIKIYNSKVRDIPHTIGDLKNLLVLKITNAKIQYIPYEIEKLKKLRELILKGNPIKEIPSSIGKLKCLKELNLSGTKIKRLPKHIGDLKELNALYLANTNISKLPKSMKRLTKLKFLDINNTNIDKKELKVIIKMLPHTTIHYNFEFINITSTFA